MAAKRVAIVTGSNKGIGFGICKLLASKGIMVVLTARDQKKGNEALEKFKDYDGLSDNIIFHQLDVLDSASISSLAHFINTKFGKLDILVNNAGIIGAVVDSDALKAAGPQITGPDMSLVKQTYESVVDCFETNYYGAKKMIETFVPLLSLSESPRIVNVTSTAGKLKNLGNEWAKTVLGDTENLNEEKIEEVLNEFLKDMKENCLASKGWTCVLPAYTLSKAAMNAYTRIAAKKYPNMKINCLCPGYVKTDANFNTGILTIEEGAENPVILALLPDDGPSGLFFDQKEITFF